MLQPCAFLNDEFFFLHLMLPGISYIKTTAMKTNLVPEWENLGHDSVFMSLKVFVKNSGS